MFNKRTYAFESLRRTAAHLAQNFETIGKSFYFSGLGEQAITVKAIHTALDLIAKTPNAAVSRHTLEAWGKQVDEAKEAFQKWAKSILTPEGDSGRDSDDLIDDDIDF